MKATLKIFFYSSYKNPLIKSFEIFGIKEFINYGSSRTIEIQDDFFSEENSRLACLKLSTGSKTIDCIFQCFNDENICYCFCDEVGRTFQLLFNNADKITIRIPTTENVLTEYDTNKNKYRKRFTLINTVFTSIKVNDIEMDLLAYNEAAPISSYQLSIYNLSKKLVVSKKLEMPKEINSFESIYQMYHQNFDDFKKEFVSALSDESNFIKNFKDLESKFSHITYPDYFLNIPKNKIIEQLDNENYIDFFYNIMIFKIYSEHIRGYEKGYKSVSEFMKYLDEKINKIKEDKDLKIYQKVLLIDQYGYILNKMTPDSFKKCEITYYKMEKKEEGSILDMIEKFFNAYIENLTEDSKIFFKLLELDSGFGYLNGKQCYCFDMSNINDIKKHLKDIFIDTLITYKMKNQTCAFIVRKTGAVAVNIKKIENIDNFFLEHRVEPSQIKQAKNVAVKIVVYLLHEMHGHKKYLYNKDNIPSPYYFIKDGNIYYLDYVYSDLEGENVIKILAENKPDDGTYYDLSYGEIYDYYTIRIIDKTKEFGELLDDINIWINDLDTIKEYFKYKYIIEKEKIDVSFSSSSPNIQDRIQAFKNSLGKNKIDVKLYYKKEKEEENLLLGKKRKKPKEKKKYSTSKKKINEINDNENSKENSESEDSEIQIEEKEEANENINFDLMSYEDLKKLYYSGKLKGIAKFECHKRISAFEISE